MTDYPNRNDNPQAPGTTGAPPADQYPAAGAAGTAGAAAMPGASGPGPAATPPPQPGATFGAGYTPQQGFSPFDPRRKSPALASVLSFVPGLGQVYVGYYQRGFVHIVVVAGIIAMLGTARLPNAAYPLLGIFLAFFWLYNIIDAGRRASLFNQVLEGKGVGTLPEEIELPRSGTMGGGLALIAVGIFFLMHTAFDWDFSWLQEWWPLFPIGFGVWLFLRGVMDRFRQEQGGERA